MMGFKVNHLELVDARAASVLNFANALNILILMGILMSFTYFILIL